MGEPNPAPDPKAPLLSVTDLCVEFPVERVGALRALQAVRHVSLTIGRGETLGLVGESGCGKSMTALALLGLVPPPGRITAGRIVFEGRNISGLGENQRRALRGARMGFVFQEPALALNPAFTIGDQIAETLVVHRRLTWRDARSRAVSLLEAVRIPHAAARATDYPHQLSGGQRQRVLLAAALAAEPPLLIADEPTTALDVTAQADILDLLRSLREAHHLSVLLITHDLGVVSELADRVAVMYAGSIVEQGPAHDVLTAPLHPYTKGLLASLPDPDDPGSALAAIPGVVPDLALLTEGCAFAPRCDARLDQCDTQRPEPAQAGPARTVRCLLHDEAR
jgi:oligopeptide/dipeptide ABC transporter ATP-binding protein